MSNASMMGAVDERQLQVNQVSIVTLVLLGFVIGGNVGTLVVAFVGASLAIGAASPGSGPFQLVYRRVLRPLGLRPHPQPGDPTAHRFAASVGAGVLLLSAFLLVVGATVSGWLLAFVVVALALVNLVFGFCAGCFVYLQLDRLRGDPVA